MLHGANNIKLNKINLVANYKNWANVMFAVRLLERAIKIDTKCALGLFAEHTEAVWLGYLKSLSFFYFCLSTNVNS
jgi:hypothetical protein